MTNIAIRNPRRMARSATVEVAPQVVAENLETCGSAPAAAVPPRQSKTDLVLELLRRTEGASLDELMKATGWLPHSTRAALTGLRKKGHVLFSEKPQEGPRIYRLTGGDRSVGAVSGE